MLNFLLCYFQSSLLLLLILLFACFAVNAQDQRISSYAHLTLDSQTNISGGNDTGTSVFALLDLGLEIPLSNQLAAHINTFLLGGENPSVNVGDFNGLNNNAGLDGIRLYRAFLAGEFEALAVTVHAGKLAVDDEFMLSDHSHLFINSGFGILPTVSGNAAIPNYPLSGIGFFLRKSIGQSGYLQAGVYDGDTGSETSNRHGLNNALSAEDGAAIFVEGAMHTLLGGLNGTWKLGGHYHSGEFEDFNSSASTDGKYSLYISLDQSLVENNEQTRLGLFYRAGISPQDDRNVVSFYNDFGIVMKGPFKQRPLDRVGLAFSYTRFSEDFVDSQRRLNTVHAGHESILELIYKIHIVDQLILSPDIQYISSPATADEDALIIGARLELSY